MANFVKTVCGRSGALFCLVYILCSIANKASSANHANCTRVCTVTDDDLSCWKDTMDYFTKQLVTSLQDYSSMMVHLSRWKQTHDNSHLTFEEEGFNKTTTDTTPLSQKKLFEIFTLIQNETLDMYESQYKKPPDDSDNTSPDLPSFKCPTPCDYSAMLWQILFTIMCCITMMTMFVCGLYMWRINRIMQRLKSGSMKKSLLADNHRMDSM